MPLPIDTLLRVHASPVPAQIVFGACGSMATAPMDCAASLSKTGLDGAAAGKAGGQLAVYVRGARGGEGESWHGRKQVQHVVRKDAQPTHRHTGLGLKDTEN